MPSPGTRVRFGSAKDPKDSLLQKFLSEGVNKGKSATMFVDMGILLGGTNVLQDYIHSFPLF
jgi:hypothetical protein